MDLKKLSPRYTYRLLALINALWTGAAAMLIGGVWAIDAVDDVHGFKPRDPLIPPCSRHRVY
jgi:hypothetical protein